MCAVASRRFYLSLWHHELLEYDTTCDQGISLRHTVRGTNTRDRGCFPQNVSPAAIAIHAVHTGCILNTSPLGPSLKHITPTTTPTPNPQPQPKPAHHPQLQLLPPTYHSTLFPKEKEVRRHRIPRPSRYYLYSWNKDVPAGVGTPN